MLGAGTNFQLKHFAVVAIWLLYFCNIIVCRLGICRCAHFNSHFNLLQNLTRSNTVCLHYGLSATFTESCRHFNVDYNVLVQFTAIYGQLS